MKGNVRGDSSGANVIVAIRVAQRLGPGAAGVLYDHGGGVYRVVILGFPFETITSAGSRAELAVRFVLYLKVVIGPLPFDYNRDGDMDVDLHDFALFQRVLTGTID